MHKLEKDELQHAFLNAIVIINSLTKSASSFISKISKSTFENSSTNQKQVEIFIKSMDAIREQTTKIEKCFDHLMKE